MVILETHYEFIIVEIKEDGSQGRVVSSNLSTKYCQQIEVGGQHGDILIGFDNNESELLSCKINDDLKVGVVGKFNLSSVMNETDIPWSIAITPCSKYIFVHTRNSLNKAAEQLIISVNGPKIELCATLDLSSERLKYFNCLAYLKTVGDELIFNGITQRSSRSPSTVLTFIYNKTKKELIELKTHRKTVDDIRFSELKRQGNALYTMGFNNSKLLKIT